MSANVIFCRLERKCWSTIRWRDTQWHIPRPSRQKLDINVTLWWCSRAGHELRRLQIAADNIQHQRTMKIYSVTSPTERHRQLPPTSTDMHGSWLSSLYEYLWLSLSFTFYFLFSSFIVYFCVCSSFVMAVCLWDRLLHKTREGHLTGW